MPNRRFLYIPLVTRTSLSGNEGYAEFCDLVRYVNESGDKSFWYVMIPIWVRDGIVPIDGVHYLYVDTVRDVRISRMAGYPAFEIAREFSRRGGRFVIDAVLTNCTLFSGYLSYLLSDPESIHNVPVFVRNKDREGWASRGRMGDSLSLASSVSMAHVAVSSSSEKRMLLEFLSSHINAKARSSFEGNVFDWGPGYDLVKRVHREPRDIAHMFCGGSFKFSFGRSLEFSVARHLESEGLAKLIISTQSTMGDISKSIGKITIPSLSILHSLAYEMYERTFHTGDFFVSAFSENMIYESEDCIKRLISGQVGIFSYSGLAMERLGDNYPFFFNSGDVTEATAMASWVSENIETARSEIEPFVDKLVAENRRDVSFGRAWRRMCSVIDQQCGEASIAHSDDGDRGPLDIAISDISSKYGEKVSLDVVLDVLEEKVPWLKPWNRKGSIKTFGEIPDNLPTMYDIRHSLSGIGWEDDCSLKDIFMIRRAL